MDTETVILGAVAIFAIWIVSSKSASTTAAQAATPESSTFGTAGPALTQGEITPLATSSPESSGANISGSIGAFVSSPGRRGRPINVR